jgi:uncharacterized membrane protein
VDTIEVSTVVYLPRDEVYDFLVDFPRYARYSKHLTRVTRHGDGEPGTEYDLTFAWWKLSYTARSRVTALSPPERIDWELVKDIDAQGHWAIEDEPVPEGKEAASRVRLRIDYHPHSANENALNLPRFVSLSWVVKKVKPLVEKEAERVVERIVADLEGERRDVSLEIHATPSD